MHFQKSMQVKISKGNAEHEASGEKHTTGAHGETDEEAVHHSSGNHDTLP